MERVVQEVQSRATSPAPRQHGSSDIVATVIASIAIALPLVFYLHQHVEILRLGYEIESLKERRVELAERSRELRIEKTREAGLDRVEEQAALLGLSAPSGSDIYLASSPVAACDESAPIAAAENGQSVVARLE